jgi:hypothetical protein
MFRRLVVAVVASISFPFSTFVHCTACARCARFNVVEQRPNTETPAASAGAVKLRLGEVAGS